MLLVVVALVVALVHIFIQKVAVVVPVVLVLRLLLIKVVMVVLVFNFLQHSMILFQL